MSEGDTLKRTVPYAEEHVSLSAIHPERSVVLNGHPKPLQHVYNFFAPYSLMNSKAHC